MNQQLLPADNELVGKIADAINEAIPEGVPSGYVMSALCLMLQIGLERAPPEIKEQSRDTILRIFARPGLQ